MTWLAGVDCDESPNQGSRGGAEVEGLIWHYTAAGSARGTVEWFKQPRTGSAHFVVARDGSIVQMVSLDRMAYHAGISEVCLPLTGETVSDVSRFTIGIEVANYGRLGGDPKNGFYYELGPSRQQFRYRGMKPEYGELVYDNGEVKAGYWEPYDERQIAACVALSDKIDSIFDRWLWHMGHQDVAMPLGRKQDPGPLFPMDVFRETGEKPELRAVNPITVPEHEAAAWLRRE